MYEASSSSDRGDFVREKLPERVGMFDGDDAYWGPFAE
jgi:hypothetical protein